MKRLTKETMTNGEKFMRLFQLRDELKNTHKRRFMIFGDDDDYQERLELSWHRRDLEDEIQQLEKELSLIKESPTIYDIAKELAVACKGLKDWNGFAYHMDDLYSWYHINSIQECYPFWKYIFVNRLSPKERSEYMKRSYFYHHLRAISDANYLDYDVPDKYKE